MTDAAHKNVQLLRDPTFYPDAEGLRAALDVHYADYETFMAGAAALGLQTAWNYYRDGKSWLCKATAGRKTIFWLSVWEGFFQVTFFFAEKARAGVEALDIAPAAKEGFGRIMPKWRILPLALRSDEASTDDMIAVARYKMSLK